MNRRKKNKTILKNIKKAYMENKDGMIDKEPKVIKRFSIMLAVLAMIMVITEIVCLFNNSKLSIIVFIVLFVLFIVLVIRYFIEEKKFKDFHKKKILDCKELCGMLIEEEADKYGVTKDQLSLYLLCNYRVPTWAKIITNVISMAFTAYAVYALPGYDQVHHGLVAFAALFLANVFTASATMFVNKYIEHSYEFDFFIIKPYEETFGEIDKKSEC